MVDRFAVVLVESGGQEFDQLKLPKEEAPVFSDDRVS